MPTQLRADIIRTLAAACEQVKAYRIGDPKSIDDVMQLIDGTLRFLEQDGAIWQARRDVLERVESAMLLVNRATDEDLPAAAGGRSHRAIRTACAHAVEAIGQLQAKVLAQGRVNAAGDRVGLGKTGTRICGPLS